MKVVDAVQAALKTEMREIKKIQEALRQLADEVEFDTQQFRMMSVLVNHLRVHKNILVKRILKMMMPSRWKVSCTRTRGWRTSWSRTWGRRGRTPSSKISLAESEAHPSHPNFVFSYHPRLSQILQNARDALDIDQTAFTLDNSSHEIQVGTWDCDLKFATMLTGKGQVTNVSPAS